MQIQKRVEPLLGCEADYKSASVVVFGAPFDSTTSFRPGTRFASRTMRNESFSIETYSPYQDKDLEDIAVFDGGDLELPFGSSERALAEIEAMEKQILQDGKIPCMIGGEHLVTLGAVRAMVQQYPDVCIVHFDAHTDLRDDYLGEKLSHATVLRRCHDLVGDGRIFQFGIRSGERDEFYWAREHTHLNKFCFDTLEESLSQIADRPIYLTMDLDVLDPSVFPGTGTPEAGGVSFLELLSAILKVAHHNVVGFDLLELSPIYDPSGASTAVALKLLRESLLAIGK